MTILIDNGHGENTPGKRSPDGRIREHAYARAIADILVSQLTADGYDARLLVPEKTDISLGERVTRANKVCAKVGSSNVILVSVHLNAAGHGGEWSSATGWSAYTTVGKTKSDILADYLYHAAMREFPGATFRTDKSDGDLDKEENFYILRKSNCPAVLTENFFQDSTKDYGLLLRPDTPARLAKLHANGIKEYIRAME